MNMKNEGTESRDRRFWKRINKTNTCWLWMGSHTVAGYGIVMRKGRIIYAHRVSYEMVNGPIPKGLEIDHMCNTPVCVNPAHLRAVTHRENIMRSNPGGFNAAKKHCPKGHEYSPENTYVYKGRRNCRACHRTYLKEYKRRQRQLKRQQNQAS